MVISSRQKRFIVPDFRFNNSVLLLRPLDVAESGRVSRISEFVNVNIKESLDAFGSADFEVSSLVSVGALSKLQTTYMSPMSSMNIADRFDNLNFVGYEQPQA